MLALDMSVVVVSETDPGHRTTYVGQVVCRNHRQVVLLLTDPYGLSGRIVEIPAESIREEITGPELEVRETRSTLLAERPRSIAKGHS